MLFFLFGFLSNANFAQSKSEKEKKTDSLFTLVKKITPAKRNEIFDSKLLKNKKIFINEKNLEKAKELMYYTYAHALLELRKKENDLFEEWEKTDCTELKPNERKKIVEKAIEEKYGKDYLGFLKTPYFLKVKILNIFETMYEQGGKPKSKKGRRNTRFQQNAKVEILDVLKGDEYYSIGDIITIAYLPQWFMWAEASPNFRVGEEYIIPLTHWNKPKDDILQVRLRGLHTLFQVKDNQVYTPLVESNFVESWSDFKNSFIDKYILEIKGGKK